LIFQKGRQKLFQKRKKNTIQTHAETHIYNKMKLK